MVINPFKPTAGKMPPILIGRQSIIEDFGEALTNGVGAPGRSMLVTG
ncbi:ATP-binding protein, partial [Bifidobacterium bifidum]